MAIITLTTFIKAPVEKVFDLARSIDLHQQSMSHTNEKAIAGRLSGFIEEGETVTWQARHLLRSRRLTSKIVSMKAPYYFCDEMVEGDFASLIHHHYFKSVNGGTEMMDVFAFKTPYGFLGVLVERLFLKNYLGKLLKSRNEIIRKEAEL